LSNPTKHLITQRFRAPAGFIQMVNVEAEYSPLKRVAVATPGKEKERLTPKNLLELQFAEIPDPMKLKEQHDDFKEKIRSFGIEVVDVRERLKSLKSEDLIPLIQPECKLSQKGLEAMPTQELAELVLAGITFTEAKEKGLLERTIVGDPSDFCVKPLLNIIFTRDPGMCMGKSYIAGKMRWESRRGEVRVLVKALGIKPEEIVSAQGGYFEGGDHMPIGYGRLLMGFGTRSSALGVNDVIPKLEEKGDLEEAVLVRLETPELHPNKGIGHLDTVMGIPAKDVIIYYKSYIDRLKVYIYKKGKVTPDDRPLREVLKDYLASDLRVVTIGDDDYYAQEREHWLLASNILVVAKDTMIAYEHNRVTNKLAREAGIKITTFEGNEIIKEGGERSGPRCSTLPLDKFG
jgi:arginine deiminase